MERQHGTEAQEVEVARVRFTWAPTGVWVVDSTTRKILSQRLCGFKNVSRMPHREGLVEARCVERPLL